MIVEQANLESVVAELAACSSLSLDTETTGLKPYSGHRLFSLIIASERVSCYFNFQSYPEHAGLPRYDTLSLLQTVLFDDPARVWYLANAKFDMHMLAADHCYLFGKLHDCLCYERLIYNKYPSYSLESVARAHGFAKSKAVDAYVTKHELFTKRMQPGKKKETRDLHFDRVPFGVIAPYGEQDGRITFDVGVSQRTKLFTFYKSLSSSDLASGKALVENERRLTQVCFEIERRGIKIDRAYCDNAFAFTSARATAAAAEFRRLTGSELTDSAKALNPLLTAVGVPPGRTAASVRFPEGQASYAKAALLKAAHHPVVQALLEYRRFSKVSGTYFRNFLDLADADDLIHGDLRQGGTDTARFSMSEPNLQNLKKNDEDAVDEESEDALDADTSFNVRRAFIPPPGYCLVMIDYDQQEYRLMLDLAGELDLIEKVKGGLDVHTATAQMMAVPRARAKTLNFLIIYGGGDGKLAQTLGIQLEPAQALRQNYFSTLPSVRTLIRSTIREAEERRMIRNWAGRYYHFARDEAYKAPNTRIQGGGADVMRFGMVRIADYLRGRKSAMIATVHDELLFQVHETELGIVPELRQIMETVYPYRYLPLTCSVSHSWKSWADKTKGAP